MLARYEAAAYPKFSQLFRVPSESSPLRHLARDPEEAKTAVVLENRSEKAITALRYRWKETDDAGKRHPQTVSSDSYTVDVYRAVAEPGSRRLITRSGSVDEGLIDHVLAGHGMVGCHVGVRRSSFDIMELSFAVDFVLFADGEIAGPDAARYASELRCHKPAAEFIAYQIRLAETEGRDVTPVLSALAAIPCFGRLGHQQGDPQVLLTKQYAREYLRAMRHQDAGPFYSRESQLRRLENRPELPKFYRRGQS